MNLDTMQMQAQFDKEFREALLNTTVIFDVKKDWIDHAKNALRFASPISLGVPSEDFETLATIKVRDMNCYQFALLSNNLEARSANDLGLPMGDYITVMKITGEYAKAWKAQTDNMRETIMAGILPKDPPKTNGSMKIVKD